MDVRAAHDMKAMTVRISSQQAEELQAVATADGVPVSEAIRQAIQNHVRVRMEDAAFRTRLRASIERNQRILDKLAE